VGLIAREIESQGIPTLSLSSALSITQSVNPPRAVFLDFPLGHTAGKALDEGLQDAIFEAALAAFETMETPGSVQKLPFHWADDDAWKDSVMRPQVAGSGGDGGDGGEHRDDRSERSAEPQYQLDADRIAAESSASR
jgi:hypothetical protein